MVMRFSAADIRVTGFALALGSALLNQRTNEKLLRPGIESPQT